MERTVNAVDFNGKTQTVTFTKLPGADASDPYDHSRWAGLVGDQAAEIIIICRRSLTWPEGSNSRDDVIVGPPESDCHWQYDPDGPGEYVAYSGEYINEGTADSFQLAAEQAVAEHSD